MNEINVNDIVSLKENELITGRVIVKKGEFITMIYNNNIYTLSEKNLRKENRQ